MKSICGAVIAAGLIMLACGCNGGFSANLGSDVSVSQNNGEITVRISGDDVIEGSGRQQKETRPVAAFQAVTVDHAIEATIEDGDSSELTVEADDNLLPLIETKVEGGVLSVRLIGSLKTKNPIRVRAAANGLSDVEATCSAAVAVAVVKGDRVRVHANSSGRATIDELRGNVIELSAGSSGQVAVKNVTGKRLRASAGSSGRVVAAGKVDEQDVEAGSSGMYEGDALVSRTARVAASSAGSASVQATEEVSGSASSAGRVQYSGNPAKVSVEESSAGSVTKG